MRYKHATNLLGLDSGLAAVSSVIVTEGSVVDRITVVVSHEWLHRERERERERKNVQIRQNTEQGNWNFFYCCRKWLIIG